MDKFEKYKLSLNEKQKDLVLDYLAKIKKFVDKHEIETELYNDIEEMVFEKLWNETEFNDLKIIKILKEVGEPEVIFSDYLQEKIDTEKESKSDLFFINLEKNGWIRDNHDAIFLWISKTLWEKIGISTFAVRVILLLLIFPLGLSIWLYILAWVLLPLKWVDYSNDSVYLFFRKQIVFAVRNWVYNLSASFLNIFPFLLKKSYWFIKVFYKLFIKNLLPVIRFVFFGIIWVSLWFAIIWLLVLLSFYLTDFSLENIDFVSSLSSYFMYGIIFSLFSLIVFSLACFSYALNKKILNKYILLSWFLSLLLSIFLFFSTALDLVQKYNSKNEIIQSWSIVLWNSWSYILDLNTYNNRWLDFWLSRASNIKLLNSTWSELKLEIKNIVYGDENIFKSYSESMINPSLISSDNTIKLSFENNNIYSKEVPFAPIFRQFILHIPQWVSINIKWYYHYFENAKVSDYYKKYSSYMDTTCWNNFVFYSQEQSSFICNPDDFELINGKRNYYSSYIRENFSDLIPIKHQENYKRKYYNDYWIYSDWMIDTIYWKDEKDDKVYVDFWDKSLSIFASFDIQETGSWITLNDFSIIDVFLDDDNFERRYYKELDLLEKFIDDENKKDF